MDRENCFNPDGLILSARYAETMNDSVLPFLSERRVQKTVSGFGGRPLACFCYEADAPRGTVLILHGFAESAFKYSEIIHSLVKNGYSVLAYDQRDHGNSWRKEGLSDNSLTHVDDFGEYEKDLEIVCGELLEGMPRPHYIFAHSMGGAVAAFFIEHHPGVFQKTVLCAPMIAPDRKGLPLFLAKGVCGLPVLRGRGDSRSFTTKPYAGLEDFSAACASGRERFDWYAGIRAAHPEYQSNSPSYRWMWEAVNVTEKLVLLPCGHMFHWKCCLNWLKKNNTCPMCRFEIK